MKQKIHTLTTTVTALALALALALPAVAATGKVNINTASPEQLQLLPRVGPSLAGRIVELRKSNDGFQSVEDLMLVRGIGESTFERMKPYVSVSGETSLSEKVRTERKPAAAAD